MKKYAVLGGGLMGRVIAKDFLDTESDARVTLIDSDEKVLDEVAMSINQDRLETYQLDITNVGMAAQLLKGHDAAVCALPHRFSLDCIKAAIQAKVPLVDLVGEAPEQRLVLHNKTVDAGIIIIPGCGVAPGLSNICVGRGVSLLDQAGEAIIYVGGIPLKKTPPLNYQAVFSLYSVFNVYNRPAVILSKGTEKTVESLSGLEQVIFPEPIGKLEAFYNDGLASLILTMKGKIKDQLAEKTLRYPGFADRVSFLKECGLLETKFITMDSTKVIPLNLLVHQLTPKLMLGPGGDWLVMRVIVKGVKDDKKQVHKFELIDQFDAKTQYTAMARTTGFPATCTARMIVKGLISEKGIQFPEQIFIDDRYDYLLSELDDYGVQIEHAIEAEVRK